MSAVFVVLMPLGALLIYTPIHTRTGTKSPIPRLHAPFQIFTVVLALAGLALGIALASPDEYTGYHPVIGYVILALLVLVQPAMGLVQHLVFRRKKKQHQQQHKTKFFGVAHRWLGRTVILLGIVNGGLGFSFAGPVGSDNVPKWGVVVYSVVAGVVGVAYTGFVIWQGLRAGDEEPVLAKEEEREVSF